MSDTNEMELAENWPDGQEPTDFTDSYDGATVTEGWAADEGQNWGTDQEQGMATEPAQDWGTEPAQYWGTDQEQGMASEPGQEWGIEPAQDWGTEPAQDWSDESGQTAAMYAAGYQGGPAPAGQGSVSQSPPAQGSTGINVEFESGPTVNGIGMDIAVRNIGSSAIPKFTVLGTYTVYKKEGLEVHPEQTLTHALDIPPGGTAHTFTDLENIPGPVMPLPDGEYRVRVHVGIVGRELSFKKQMGKVQP